MNKASSPADDEFKYGFPSSGLSSISFRWWGDEGDADDHPQQSVGEVAKETSQESNNDLVDNAGSDSLSPDAKVASKGKKEATDGQPAGLLTGLRKKAAEEGRRGLKLGVYRGYDDAKTLDRNKKAVLVQIFKSCLPDEWSNVSSQGLITK